MILSEEQIEHHLDELNDWTLKNKKLSKVFKFSDFAQAFEFMSLVAIIAETMDHHPEWSNTYNKVAVNLITHDVGGISELDIKLANKMEMFK